MQALIMRFAALSLLLWTGCADEGGNPGTLPPEALPIALTQVESGLVLPGSSLQVTGANFIEDASYSGIIDGQINGGPVQLAVNLVYTDSSTLTLEFPTDGFGTVGEGTLGGLLTVEARRGPTVGSASLSVAFDVRQTLAPEVVSVATGVFPASPVAVRGTGFIADAEGSSVIELRGSYAPDEGGGPRDIAVDGVAAARPVGLVNWARDTLEFVFFPDWAGIKPGTITGELRVVNQGQGWQRAGEWIPVRFDLLPPTIEQLGVTSASRGQAVPITGQGFLGGTVGGFTVLRLRGVFTPQGGEPIDLGPNGLELAPDWRSGRSLVFSMRVRYDFDCSSTDLGARAGVLEGSITPEIGWQGDVVVGPSLPLVFQIQPNRQVVHLSFLPAFTDSLRLFGLRNVSGDVKARILEVVRRDYDGINLEVRLEAPTDFLRYALVEVGGPDPNAQQLFGLDNSAGLDRCNQRLDDLLAGHNADSEGFGGIFVESFLQLSPKRGTQNPLANTQFDDIFEPVIDDPVETGEYPGGSRDGKVARAIETLGNLVGNTVTHEIGHSLGLPVAPGCGQYHNAPGDRQIMDCGADRPFEERAGITEPATWTPENREYLERHLPLR